ncbi:MAG TPA: hypothetical protein VMS77_03230 [Conexivisphaerales archaeon]|nr:hypothetical protein [Conexivisphaerales archaeon]
MALLSALLLAMGWATICPAFGSGLDSAAAAAVPLQAQAGNETILLSLNTTKVFVRDSIMVIGQLTPPRAVDFLLTLTWPDGSWTNFRVSSNDSGLFSYGLYIPGEGQFRIVASLLDQNQVLSNTVSFVASYRPINETSTVTTSYSSSVTSSSSSSSSTTSSGGSTLTTTQSQTSPAAGFPPSTAATVAFFAVAIAVIALSAYSLRRKGPAKS